MLNRREADPMPVELDCFFVRNAAVARRAPVNLRLRRAGEANGEKARKSEAGRSSEILPGCHVGVKASRIMPPPPGDDQQARRALAKA
jgi:hypothetical protein